MKQEKLPMPSPRLLCAKIASEAIRSADKPTLSMLLCEPTYCRAKCSMHEFVPKLAQCQCKGAS